MNEEQKPSQGPRPSDDSGVNPFASAPPAVSPPNSQGTPQGPEQEYIPTGPLYPALEARLNNLSGPASQSGQPASQPPANPPSQPLSQSMSQPPAGAMPSAPGYPPYPTYPGYPAYPGSPSMPLGPYAGQMSFNQPAEGQVPAYAGPPSAPLYPGYPNVPGYPGIPGTPGGQPPYAGPPSMPIPYPGSPSMPLDANGQPVMPSYPNYPGYPGYPGSPSMPLSPQTIPGFGPTSTVLTRPNEPNILQKPFSRVIVVAVALAALVILALTYAVDVLLGADWANGARLAGFVAFGLAGAALVVLVARLIAGRRALATILLGGVLVCVLLASGGAGIGLTPEIHHLQGSVLENGHQWSQAIAEYRLSGEAAPNAPDIARTYDEWGEQFLAENNYGQAVQHFTIVVNTYNRDEATLNRANADLFRAYSAWIKTNGTDVPYADAVQFLTGYQSNSQCDATCQSEVVEVTAQAYYQWGTLLYNRGSYQQAVDELEQAQTYAKSSYATLAHTEAAKAYLSLGKQQISSDCESAIPTYQTLAQRYSDTPEGKEAKKELAAPQNVTGQITGLPAGAATIMYLSRHANPNSFFASLPSGVSL